MLFQKTMRICKKLSVWKIWIHKNDNNSIVSSGSYNRNENKKNNKNSNMNKPDNYHDRRRSITMRRFHLRQCIAPKKGWEHCAFLPISNIPLLSKDCESKREADPFHIGYKCGQEARKHNLIASFNSWPMPANHIIFSRSDRLVDEIFHIQRRCCRIRKSRVEKGNARTWVFSTVHSVACNLSSTGVRILWNPQLLSLKKVSSHMGYAVRLMPKL